MRDQDEIRRLLEAGHSRSEIARRLGLNNATVSRTAIRLGFPRLVARPSPYDWAAIRAYYEDGYTRRECAERFGISAGAWDRAIARGDIVPRPRSARRVTGKTRAKIRQLAASGTSQARIAAQLGLSKATIAYHFRKLGIPADERFARRYDWAEIQRAYDSGLSIRQCANLFGFSNAVWHKAAQRGDVVSRSREMSLEELLVAGRHRGRGHLKRRLIRAGLKENRCEECGVDSWRGQPLNIALHHVNGDGHDNRLENLLFLCPNCHSQTPNYGGRNGHRRPATRSHDRRQVGNDV
jgi:DNA-binding CsgD family transcriptional regulator